MLATTFSGALFGVESVPVRVEVDLARGLPCFHIVGLAETAVRESRERVRAALKNCGYEMAPGRVTVNLAPADLRKSGGGYDLAIAVAVLSANGVVPAEAIAGVCLVGELSLDATLRPVRGTLAHALAARGAGLKTMIVAEAAAAEAAAIRNLRIHGAADLGSVVGFLQGVHELPRARTAAAPRSAPTEAATDLREVRGQLLGRRALEVAAAGGHHLLLVGPPGCGKTMLARRLPSILPPLEAEEALQTSLVHGAVRPLEGLVSDRPFRAPHHTASAAALIGGGWPPRPGEASLAHNGVLFLDEFPEFRRDAVEALREAMDQGEVFFARARSRIRMPSRFQLVVAANPCPCGRPAALGGCVCAPGAAQGYRSRLVGPLVDRIDLRVALGPVPRQDLLDGSEPESSGSVCRRAA